MNTTTTTAALQHFAEVWTGDVADEVARALSCHEVDALAGLFRAAQREGMAHAWINAHAWHDDQGDAHYWTATETVRAHFEEVAATVPGIELCEEDPHTFGAGHLVFYKHRDDARQDSRLAFTEICDLPDEDPERTVTGYSWIATRRDADGVDQTTATGSASIDVLDVLTTAAWRWARE